MRGPPASSPDEYVERLSGWRREVVSTLRTLARSATDAEEVVKWGPLVYLSDGPAFLIRAEAERVLFGFWRGQRLREIEPRLKPGGKYEMATMAFLKEDGIDARVVTALVTEALALNAALGDPRDAARGAP